MNETKKEDAFSVPEYKRYEIDLSADEEAAKKVDEDVYLPYNGLDAELKIEPVEAVFHAGDMHPPKKEITKSLSKKDFNLILAFVMEFLLRFIERTGDITISTVLHYTANHRRRIKKASRSLSKKIRKTGFEIKKSVIAFFQSFTLKNLSAKTVFNLLFPIVSIAALVLFIRYAGNTTFALDVVYNDQHIGYIESEDTFEAAKTLALKMIQSDESSDSPLLLSEPTYKVRRVSFNALSNSSMICENMIESSDISLTRACGIYIDGEFLCAVRNESDAVSVFNSIIAPSKAKADADTIVAFVEEIEYVEGLYPDTQETIWDSLKLKKTLQTPKREAKYYKIQRGDNASAIASKNDLTVKQLKALNPETDFKKLKAGRKLLVAAQTEYVRIKVMKTRTKKQRVPFETIKKESSYYAKGTTKVYQKGSYGEKVTTELVTYINAVETYSTVVSVKQTKAPVNKIIYIGTKEAYSGYSSDSSSYSAPSYSSGMIWPTRGAYSLSSHFGYRSAWISGWSFHGGVDIVKSGGPSTGTPVIAAASGTVVVAQSGYSGYGHTVVIDHGNGLQTRYAHMYPGSILVYPGQHVYQGQQIGNIGATGNVTGPHLHFEVLKNGSKVNPLNYIG